MKTLGKIFGIVGVIMLFFGVVSYALTQVRSIFFYVHAIGGASFIVLYFVLIFIKTKTLWGDAILDRSTKYALNVIVYSFLALLILVAINLLGNFVDWKTDLTENQINTLADQSIKILKDLKKEVKILAVIADKNRLKEPLKEILDRYTSQSKMVKVEFADPDLKPQLAKQHNAKDGNIVISYGSEETLITDISEEAITSAIIKVTKTTKPMTCFTQGHGEMKLTGEEEDSLSAVAGGVKNEGYETRNLENINQGIPEDCDILVVAGPRIPFTKRESAVTEEYLNKGGKGFFMLDPRLPDPRLGGKLVVLDSGLEDLAQNSGVILGKDFILEKSIELFTGPTLKPTIQAIKYADHPVVAPLEGKYTLFPRGVRSITASKRAGNYGTVTELVSSGEGKGVSWAEKSVDKLFRLQKAEQETDDISGPVPFAVAIEKDISKPATQKGNQDPVSLDASADEKAKKRKKTKSVWIGNSTFISNQYARTAEFNFDLFLNTLSWLWGEESRISIRPKMLRTSVLVLTPEQSNIIFYVSVLAIPEIILVSGLVIWIFRRKK